MTISIATTSNAKVFDLDQVSDCVATCNDACTDKSLGNLLIIEEVTLKGLAADAKGYKSALEELVKAQADLNRTSKKLNEALESVHDADVALREAGAPPWYKSPVIWGSVGLVIGIVATASIQISAR